MIERSEYQGCVDKNKENIKKDPAIYKRRQAIIEHTYGILKRQWGFYFISTKKGIKHASSDVGFMFTALNLRRLINTIDKKLFKKFLRELAYLFSAKMNSINPFSSIIRLSFFFNQLMQSKNKPAAQRFMISDY